MFSALQSWLSQRFGPRSLGERGEQYAARYLRRLGYHIVGQRVDMGAGELDIVAVDDRTVVFVEVKTRISDAAGAPADAVDDRRQQRLTRAALAYLKSHGLLEHPARFDVVAVTWPDDARTPNVDHIRDAFPALGRGQFFS